MHSQLLSSFPRAAAILLAAIALSNTTACSSGNAEAGAALLPHLPPEVSVAPPVVRAHYPLRQYPARVEAVNRIELRPRVSGHIESVLFAEGSLVEKGQILFRIDAEPYRTRLDRAEAELALALANHKLADTERSRAQRLADKDAISHQELDRWNTEWSTSLAHVAAARSIRSLAALELSNTEVTAPITGHIGRALVSSGNQVSGSNDGGSLLAILVSTDPVYVLFDVDEGTASKAMMHAHHPATIKFTGSSNPLTTHVGTLAFLENEFGSGTGTLRTRGLISNPDHLLMPGMLGRISLELPQPVDSILIDEKAIGTDQGQRYVLVVGAQNRAEYRPITLGDRVGSLRIVTNGLSSADLILVSGLMRVRPGSEIRPAIVDMEHTDLNNASASVPTIPLEG